MRRAGLVVVVSLCALAVSGCSSHKPAPVPVTSSAPPQAQIARFNDIAVPPGNTLDLERTVVFGADREWIGRLALTSKLSVSEAYDFFRHEMPRLGWSEVTSVRSSTAVLTYQMEGRVATIQIGGARSGSGSQIDFWMNPRGMTPRGEMSVQAPPASPGPGYSRSEPPAPAADQNAAAPRGRVDEAPLPPYRR